MLIHKEDLEKVRFFSLTNPQGLQDCCYEIHCLVIPVSLVTLDSSCHRCNAYTRPVTAQTADY